MSHSTGDQLGANLESGLKLSAGIVNIQPLVALQYLYVSQQGVQESGGPAALNTSRTNGNALRAGIGGRMSINPITGPFGAVWTPFTQARLVSELLDNDHVVSATFNGAPVGSAFLVHGTRVGPIYGLLGEWVEVKLNNWFSVFGGADVQVGDRVSIGAGSMSAVLTW
jgi:outer membrane autotransporter protein